MCYFYFLRTCPTDAISGGGGGGEASAGTMAPAIDRAAQQRALAQRVLQARGEEDTVRGSCRKCGGLGHLTFQCRNHLDLPLVDDNAPPSAAPPVFGAEPHADNDDDSGSYTCE